MNSFKKNIYKMQSTSIPSNAEFFPFDFMVVRFIYITPEQGTNLDVMVGYENTNTIFDNDYVGNNQLPNDVKIPNNSTADQEAYLWWGGDDVSIISGLRVEAVVINLKKLLTQNTVINRYVHIPLRLSWHEAKGSGSITLNFTTYEGGIIVPNGTNFTVQNPINETSVSVYNNLVNSVGQATLLNSTLIGTVIYDSLTRQAVLI